MRRIAAGLVPLVVICAAAAYAGSDALRTRVTPAKTVAGERITVSARGVPSGRRCTATIERPGARRARLRARTAVRGSVSWPWTVPQNAKGGIGRARVACRRAGSDDARFSISALPAGDPIAGKTVFLLNCGGCHTLADAGTQGTSLDLDVTMPTSTKTVDRVVNGKGLMPSFKTRLTPQQIADVAAYVSSVAGR